MISSTVDVWLRFSRRIIFVILRKHPMAKVSMPSAEKAKEYKDSIVQSFPSLNNVYCVADGLKLRIQSSSAAIVQEKFYNGWTHDHYITNLFVFGPDGTIIACVLNCPGSMHDSELASFGNVYDKLQSAYDDHGGICVMDSAFCARGKPFVLKSVQDINAGGSATEILRLQQATSMRQAAEWGMRALQGSFPRLKVRMVYEEKGERLVILKTMVLLYNWRANTVGLNQIRSTFMNHLNKNCDQFITTII
jgi:hypothetical protein